MKERILWEYSQGIPGPLVIVLCAVHGNEWAGVRAMELLEKMLEVEPVRNPSFQFKGRAIALMGNVEAYGRKERFVHTDLNRMWTEQTIHLAREKPDEERSVEEKELIDLQELLDHYIVDYQGDEVIIIDLHTTSAGGGIFSIVPDHPKIIELAVGMYAPVITGFSKAILGTSIDYWNRSYKEKWVHCLAFEAGQHDDPTSVNMSIAATINLLRFVGCLRPEDVENVHDNMLRTFSSGLPQFSELLCVYKIPNGAHFEMVEGFLNFQKIQAGELLATVNGQAIRAEENARLLMPRYQKRGSDGFFLIESRSATYL